MMAAASSTKIRTDTFYMKVGRVSEITCFAVSIDLWLSFKLSKIIHKLSIPVFATVIYLEAVPPLFRLPVVRHVCSAKTDR
jgi:hypothetical protein